MSNSRVRKDRRQGKNTIATPNVADAVVVVPKHPKLAKVGHSVVNFDLHKAVKPLAPVGRVLFDTSAADIKNGVVSLKDVVVSGRICGNLAARKAARIAARQYRRNLLADNLVVADDGIHDKILTLDPS